MLYLKHNRIRLALHTLRAGAGRALLLLHGLGEQSPRRLAPELAGWPGPVHALDFTGHGGSTVPRGGGYSCELLLADADVALAQLHEATLAGRGLGAYVALLLAGARPEHVRGAVLRDGPGLSTGAPYEFLPFVDPSHIGPPDPFALVELATETRSGDYACAFVQRAVQCSGSPRPISVCALERPEWLAAVSEQPGVRLTTLAEALSWHARDGA
jgi:pimeloyl-ACP methyl ester carboxylesterase